MALTGANLVDEVQALTGRTGSDTVLCDDTRVTRWLNEGQRDIVEKIPGMHAVTFKNTTSVDTTAKLSYPLTDWTVGDATSQTICSVWKVAYMDGVDSIDLRYIHVDEFDDAYTDPTHTDYPTDRPTVWTRRGNAIEMYPLPSSSYYNKDIRVDGDFYPEDFTTNDADSSDLSQCDDGLIYYAVARSWGAIGDEVKAKIWEGKYEDWVEKRKAKNDIIPGWSGSMFEDAME